jgi:hypothetical protein
MHNDHAVVDGISPKSLQITEMFKTKRIFFKTNGTKAKISIIAKISAKPVSEISNSRPLAFFKIDKILGEIL